MTQVIIVSAIMSVAFLLFVALPAAIRLGGSILRAEGDGNSIGDNGVNDGGNPFGGGWDDEAPF